VFNVNFYSLTAKLLDGTTFELDQLEGRVSLVVNVASACGFTPQYAGLQALHTELEAQGAGLAVLGFPCNDFGKQEPGSAEQIRDFCDTRFRVTFPLFEKVVVKAGPEQSPLFHALQEATGKLPNWNFCKYLIGRDGTPLGFFESKVEPNDPALRKAIETALSTTG
jgi:glutathione peroxidase